MLQKSGDEKPNWDGAKTWEVNIWYIHHINWLARFLNHQQYHIIPLHLCTSVINSKATPRTRKISRLRCERTVSHETERVACPNSPFKYRNKYKIYIYQIYIYTVCILYNMYLFAPWGHQRHEVFWKKTSKETHHLVWAKFGETEIWNSDIYVRACKLNVRSSTSMAAAIFNHDFENLMELFQRCFFISELACHSACASCTHAHIFLYHKFGELGK